uniref:Uncharacterized protein n=1 Tax=Rhizophora mucronata TaxID=61149 RepID=A0A2P2P600_RHIMU
MFQRNHIMILEAKTPILAMSRDTFVKRESWILSLHITDNVANARS